MCYDSTNKRKKIDGRKQPLSLMLVMKLQFGCVCMLISDIKLYA